MIKNKDFNLLFLGRLFANFGDSLYGIATALLVYKLTESTFYSGFALFLTSSTGIAQILFSPLLDRINIKKGLIWTQFLQSILLLLIPIFYMIDQLTVPKILIIMPLITLINQFIYPSQLSLLPRILDEKELLKGNTLFTLAYQGSDAVFNALAGVLISILGVFTVYYISSVSFLINVILFLFLSQVVATTSVNQHERASHPMQQYKKDLAISFDILKNKLLFSILIGFILINFFTTSIYANLPAFSSSDIQYSFYMASSGIGIIIGSLILNTQLFERMSLKKIYAGSAMIIGLAWIAMVIFSGTSLFSTILSVIAFFTGWIPIGIINILSQTVIQTIIPKDKVGVVLGTTIGLSTCLTPFGALLGGIFGNIFSPELAIGLSALAIFFIGLYWLFNKALTRTQTLKLLAKERIDTNGY